MELTVTMVGATFRPAEAKDILRSLHPGTSLTLEPDPDNPYDDHAVQVLYNTVHLGFIPKTDNRVLFEHLCAGESYSCEIIGFENTLKPVLEINLPNV